MSYIFEQTVGIHRYVYEGTSYRNSNGKPRNKRTPIGKVDLKTGQRIYYNEYIERMKLEGTPIGLSDDLITFSVDDIKNLHYGNLGFSIYYRHWPKKMV